ncbi:DUF3168 domain-containing protein [Azotobacter bryophylli]|uniref:DUF3168 domain-containing protein n=1 Tax=Azotobacter bryophylli TaxID=1986537 RepID=A0ABV7APF3_9GAMM
MSDPSIAVQTGLYQLLTTGLSCPVYDAVPKDSAFPYVTIDYEVAANRDFLASRMDERFLYLSVWSQYPGQAEVKRLMGEIDAAVHGKSLPLASGQSTRISVRSKSTNREPDGHTYQGQVVLQVLTQH